MFQKAAVYSRAGSSRMSQQFAKATPMHIDHDNFIQRVIDTGITPGYVQRSMARTFSDISDDGYQEVFQGVTKKVAILFTERSGSTLLAEKLNKTGALGNVREHLNPGAIERRTAKWGVTSMQEYLTRMVADNRTEDGIFAFKANLDRLLPLVQVGELPDHVAEWNWVVVYRGDMIAQSVSRHRARKTGVWHNKGGSGQNVKVPPFDIDALRNSYDALLKKQGQIDRFLRLHKQKALYVRYEDFKDDPAPVLRKIFRHVGVEKPSNLRRLMKRGRLEVMRNKTSNDHAERLRKHLLDRPKPFLIKLIKR